MITRLRSSLALAASLLLAASACRGTPPPHSGLLGDLSAFDRRDKDTWIHWAVDPDDLRGYERMRLDRVSVLLPMGTSVPPGVQRELRQMLQRALEAELDYEFVTGELRTEGTIAARALIVDVQRGVEPELGSVTIEFELLDALTGERLFASILRRHARNVTDTTKERRAETEHAFSEWSRELHAWVNEYLEG